MPKETWKQQDRRQKPCFYAVRIGREGPKVYSSWTECQLHVKGYSGNSYKGFQTRKEAEEWISSGLTLFRPAGKRQDNPFPLNVIQVASSYSHTPIKVEQGPIIGESQEDNTTVNVTSVSTTARGGVDLNEAIPCPPVVPVEGPQTVLSDEQQRVVDLALAGKSLFFTGSAGTGKSLTLKELVRVLRLRNEGRRVFVTASTGIAGVAIGGTTLHSWAGIGLGKGPVENLRWKILTKHDARLRWKTTNVLVIDEVSMVDGGFLDKLEAIARFVRDDPRPFGGIQLILCGDFYQLPPVPDTINGEKLPITFAFDSRTWTTCITEIITLRKVFRQADPVFADFLNQMRFGTISPRARAPFASLEREVKYSDGGELVQLYALRAQVEHANSSRLSALQGDTQTYQAHDIPGVDITGRPIDGKRATGLADQTLAPRELPLKLGAQVMLIMNLTKTSNALVNGSLGIVKDFLTVQKAQKSDLLCLGDYMSKEDTEVDLPHDEQKWPVIHFHKSDHILLLTPTKFEVVNGLGDVEATREQIPLILAWAISIHKSQGQTIDRLKVDLSAIFEKGQAYVALSRATSLERLQVLRFEANKVLAHPRVIEWSANQRRLAMVTEIEKEP